MVFAVSSFPLAGLLDKHRGFFTKPQFRHFQTVFAGLMLKGKGEKNLISSFERSGRPLPTLDGPPPSG